MHEVMGLFRAPRVERDIRGGVEFVNVLTGEYVFMDPEYDSEDAWAERGVWDVCCITKLVHKLVEDRFGMYAPSNDVDVDISEVSMRIATEPGWQVCDWFCKE